MKSHVSSRFTTCFLVRPPYLLPKGRLFDLLDLLKAWLQLRSINLTEFVSFVEMIDPRGPNSSGQPYCPELQEIAIAEDFDSGRHKEE